MELLIFTANQTGNKKNCYYPNRVVAKNTAELQKAVMMDHVCAEYRNDYRSNANFMQSVVVVMDCDNDHSELPGDWMTPDKLKALLPTVAFAIAPSRNNMKEKDGKSARPRFHVYFFIHAITDSSKYAALKRAIWKRFPFFDGNALDAGRFIYGADAGECIWHDGGTLIDDIVTVEESEHGSYDSGVIPAGMDKVNTKVDVSALEEERERIRKLLRQVMGAKAKLTDMLDKLDVMDKHYDRKYQDMHDRLDNLYDKISEYEDSIADITAKIEAVYGNQITGKQIYDILVHFEMMYYKMTDLEKKEFMKDFINSIELYPEKMDNGSIVKQINFKFGVYYEGHETMDIRLLNENTVETVCLLGRRKPDDTIKVSVNMDDYYQIRDAEEAEKNPS